MWILPAQPWFAVVHKSNHISGIDSSCKCRFSCAHVIHCKILNAFSFLNYSTLQNYAQAPYYSVVSATRALWNAGYLLVLLVRRLFQHYFHAVLKVHSFFHYNLINLTYFPSFNENFWFQVIFSPDCIATIYTWHHLALFSTLFQLILVQLLFDPLTMPHKWIIFGGRLQLNNFSLRILRLRYWRFVSS